VSPWTPTAPPGEDDFIKQYPLISEKGDICVLEGSGEKVYYKDTPVCADCLDDIYVDYHLKERGALLLRHWHSRSHICVRCREKTFVIFKGAFLDERDNQANLGRLD